MNNLMTKLADQFILDKGKLLYCNFGRLPISKGIFEG